MTMAAMIGKNEILTLELAGKGNGGKFLPYAGMNGAVQLAQGEQFQEFLLYPAYPEGFFENLMIDLYLRRLHNLKNSSCYYRYGWIAFIDRIGLQVLLGHRVHPQYAMRSASGAAKDNGLGADPYPVLQHDWIGYKIKARSGMIMAAGKQKTTLRKIDVLPDGHLGEVIDPYLLANPGMVAYFQFPGILYVYRRLDHHALSQLRSKQFQQGNFQGGDDIQRVFKKEDIRKIPGNLPEPGSPDINGSLIGGVVNLFPYSCAHTNKLRY
jgi:hypothetical protein